MIYDNLRSVSMTLLLRARFFSLHLNRASIFMALKKMIGSQSWRDIGRSNIADPAHYGNGVFANVYFSDGLQ